MLNKIIKFVSKHNNNWLGLSIIFVVVCIVILPLPLMGIPTGTDLTQHLQFASTYQDAILSGDFFPGWAATDNSGLGSIGIRFYPPFAYYLLALTNMIMGSWYDSFWINAFFWMFIGSLGMYLWAKEWLSPVESAFVAIFYAIAPYHRFQIYQLILFAEFAAAGVLPFCFYTITRLIRRGKPIDIILFSISFGILILTHIPTTVLGTIGLGIYSLSLIDWKNYKRDFFNLFIAGFLSLSASSFHWLRLVSEMSWVKHTSSNYTVEFYDYKQHLFPMTLKLKALMPPLDSAVIFLILCLLPLVVFSLVRIKVKYEDVAEKKVIIALIIAGTICAFLTTSPSLFIWENLTFLQKVQFPWRFLSVAFVITSLGFIFSISKLIKIFQALKPLLLYLSILIFLPVLLYYFVQTVSPTLTLSRADFAKETENLKAKRGCECWRPNWSQNEAFEQKEKITTDGRNYNINKWDSEFREFVVEPGASQKIKVTTFYYPYWKAFVNQKPVEIEAGSDGTILIPIGEEQATVELRFVEPFMLQFALAVSLLTWLFLLVSLSYFYLNNRKLNHLK